MTRRQAMSGLGAFSCLPINRVTSALGRPDESLGAKAARAGVAFGSCFEQEVIKDTSYQKIFLDESRIAINANAFKFDWLRPTGPKADFTQADRLLEFAEAAKIPFRATTLIWNDWIPEWLKTRAQREVIAIFDAHIEETVSRYAGRIHSWDVVNEPFAPWDHQPGIYRKGAWFEAMGPGYIDRAFKRARSADKRVKLLLNEAFCERQDDLGGAVRPALLNLVKRLKDADVPLHVVGLQGHLQPRYPFDDAAFAKFASDIAAEGVDIYITELDVDDRGLPDDIDRRDAIVAARYRDFLSHVLAVPAVKVVIMWGLSDMYTWYRDVAREEGTLERRSPRALPYDYAFQRKPAWFAMAEAFDKHAKAISR